MSRAIGIGGLVLTALGISSSVLAVPVPVSWWTFDNEEGQFLGTYDGVIRDQGPRGIHLGVSQWNGGPGGPNTNFTSMIDDNRSTPSGSGIVPEHYVASQARIPGAGSAYNMEGATHRTYTDPVTGLADTDAVDPQTQPIGLTYPYDFAYRDVLEPEPDETAGGLYDGNLITYSFWMAVPSVPLGNDQNMARMISRSSYIGQGGGWGGDVNVRWSGSLFNPTYRFTFQNTQGVSTSDVTFRTGEWHHYVVEYDLTGEEGVVTVWQDGGLLNTSPAFGDTPNREVLGGLDTLPIFGRFRLNQTAHWSPEFPEEGVRAQLSGNFHFDELAIWNGVSLSDEDVYELFSSGLAASLSSEIDVRHWNPSSQEGDWSGQENWHVPGTPDSDWITRLDNISNPAGLLSIVDTESTVDTISVNGPAGAMRLEVADIATLTSSQLQLGVGGQLGGGGFVFGDVVNNGGILGPGHYEVESLAASILGTQSVPEPCGATLSIVALVLLASRRRAG